MAVVSERASPKRACKTEVNYQNQEDEDSDSDDIVCKPKPKRRKAGKASTLT